ncbi:MAG: GDSL-type esterase/lipase family protein [Oliverpabstia sp.]
MDKDKRKRRMQALALIAFVLVGWNIMQLMSSHPIQKIACVGDSITFGTGIENREDNCYPVLLQNALGTEDYQVGNFGVEGAAVQKNSDKPYCEEERFQKSIDFEPDIVILMLGTNDTKAVNWKDGASFQNDYEAMLKSYASLSSSLSMIAMTPPALFAFSEDGQAIKAEADAIICEEAKIIREICQDKKIPVIDLYEISGSHPEWFNSDGVHPNENGAEAIAKEVETVVRQIFKTQDK